ncbi:hypothetical protein LPJ66_003219 [Kickxella alabastrina]|uniref:Uncharacterized protein n=1 Tax=Kickxella alabastrina TaxID=61397 RepID=A0ACC1IM09_9FUNG|nr:hypothetical protein LPJ66_003219 [Kickxella alabastrina]
MSLAAGANALQTTAANILLSKNPLLQLLCTGAVLTSEITYAILSKFDPSVPSALSRIDRLIMDSKHQSKKNKQQNEQKIAIITGANSGIGYETAKALGRAGYHVIMACRNLEYAAEAKARLIRQTGLEDGQFEIMQVDLASLSSVQGFVEEFKRRKVALDILVCNAGVMACPLGYTQDQVEMQFGTNHLGHFALTTGVLDQLKDASDGARVVIVSSMGSFMTAEISYESIEQPAQYSRTVNYGISKLANMTFAATLARKLEGSGVSVNSLHPGTVVTPLYRHVGGTIGVMKMVESAVMLDEVAGAVTSVMLALGDDVGSGKFYNRGLIMEMHPRARDVREQDKLWEYSEKLVTEKSTKR